MLCVSQTSDPRCRSELIDSVWVVIVPGQKCIKKQQKKLAHNKLVIISASHTLQISEENPNDREDFYEILETLVDKIPKRDIVIIAGDFNAKTGSARDEFKENMGKFGKELLNSSGRRLLEMCRKEDIVLTNTISDHKKCHRITWIAPYRNFTTWDGEERRNPVRNQVDYIIIRNEHRFTTDSRSFGGITTDTDHKLVKMDMHLEWYKLKGSIRGKEHKIDVRGFSDENKRVLYEKNVEKNMATVSQTEAGQEKWNNICKITKEVGTKIMGTKKLRKKHNDTTMETLSKKHHKIKNDIEACTDNNIRSNKLIEKKCIKKQLQKRVKKIVEQELNSKYSVNTT